jgi:hypothetical protein
MTGAEFVQVVLTRLDEAARTGQQFLFELNKVDKRGTSAVKDVFSLAVHPSEKTEYLLGAESRWSDIQSGRAILRRIDDEIMNSAAPLLVAPKMKGVLLISGTAGSGKGTSLKRVALSLSANGSSVAWVDAQGEASPLAIKKAMQARKGPAVVAIDEADLFGTELSSLIREICTADTHPLVILAIRSGRIDRVLNRVQLEEVPIVEHAMPGLTDGEIDSLLDVLTLENRLGVLLNKPRTTQRQVFREQCGRQLLVAMIEATSGKPFEEKVKGEFGELEGEMQTVYAMVAVASAFRFFLTKQDILLGQDEATNDVLNAISRLVQRQIIICEDDTRFMARHRVIADLIFSDLAHNGTVAEVFLALARAAALQITQGDSPNTRHRRLIRHGRAISIKPKLRSSYWPRTGLDPF